MPNTEKFENRHPLWFYIRKNKKNFSLGMIFLLITNGLDSSYPLILKRGIDQISQGAGREALLETTLLFITVMSSLALTRYLWRVYFGRYHTEAAEDLRNRIFNHFTDMGPKFFQNNPTGELMSLITNDVQSFRTAIGSGLLILVDGIVILAFCLPAMIYLQPQWTWKTLIFLPLVPFLIWKVTGMIYSRYKKQQDTLAELSGFSQELVSGIRVIKSFSQENNKLGAYNEISRKYETDCNRMAKVDSLFFPVMQFGIASGTVILLFIASDEVLTGAVTIGTLVAFQRYIAKMVWPMTAFGLGLSQFQKGMASFDRIKKVLTVKQEIPDHGSLVLEKFESLEIRDLDFYYPESTSAALRKISVQISRGEKVGLVGMVGSGKSTLLQLLTRLYPIDSGKILINGQSLEAYKLDSLRAKIALVPQEPFLFSASIGENISYGLKTALPESELLRWAKLVDIDNEIRDLNGGYNAQLGERGVNLSGGQKQRLALARGMAIQSDVIMLDDTLSAVDHKTEKSILAHLKNEKRKDQTLIISSHRLSSVIDADKIIVFNAGTIEAIGRHRDLLKSSPTYRKIAEIQGSHHE